MVGGGGLVVVVEGTVVPVVDVTAVSPEHAETTSTRQNRHAKVRHIDFIKCDETGE